MLHNRVVPREKQDSNSLTQHCAQVQSTWPCPTWLGSVPGCKRFCQVGRLLVYGDGKGSWAPHSWDLVGHGRRGSLNSYPVACSWSHRTFQALDSDVSELKLKFRTNCTDMAEKNNWGKKTSFPTHLWEAAVSSRCDSVQTVLILQAGGPGSMPSITKKQTQIDSKPLLIINPRNHPCFLLLSLGTISRTKYHL